MPAALMAPRARPIPNLPTERERRAVVVGDESDERRPTGEVLAGTASTRSGRGGPPWRPSCSFKCIDETGDAAWSFRTTHPLNLEELLGALTVQVETLKRKLVRTWEDEDPDDRD